MDLSLAGLDSTTARTHHVAAGMHLAPELLAALEKAAAEEERSRRQEEEGQQGRPAPRYDAALYKEP